jgi:hypothetical protein
MAVKENQITKQLQTEIDYADVELLTNLLQTEERHKQQDRQARLYDYQYQKPYWNLSRNI